jgi:hypothetical protein
MVINNFIRLFIHYNLILKILFNIKCILETYMKPHLQFATHVKQTSNHNTRCSPVMDVTIRDKIKTQIFSKDWVASSKLSSIYNILIKHGINIYTIYYIYNTNS